MNSLFARSLLSIYLGENLKDLHACWRKLVVNNDRKKNRFVCLLFIVHYLVFHSWLAYACWKPSYRVIMIERKRDLMRQTSIREMSQQPRHAQDQLVVWLV